jgi:hypothetical protein
MKLSQEAIRRLLNKDETEFIESLAADRIDAVTPARLRQKLDRARRLRDKYRDLARRQGGEMRGKASPRSTRAARGNANTLRKVQIFEWAIDRISGRLDAGGQTAQARADRPEAARREPDDQTVESVQPRIVEILKEAETLSFGDLWAAMPEVPVQTLRKALWSLSEAGAIDLTDDAGVALATEADVADDVEVEVEIDRPAPFVEPPAGPAPAGRPGKPARGGSGHHPKVRIHSHLRAAGRRSQARRDRKR